MDYLKHLNNNQYIAVTTKEKRVLVLAGAGSGKTRVLTSKIKYLLDNDTVESQILAFTFTKKAANEMKYRVEKLTSKETRVRICTFHSFAFELISFLYLYLGFEKLLTIIDETDKNKLLTEIIHNINSPYSVKQYSKAISEIKNYTQTTYTTEESLRYNEVYQLYQQKLKQHNYIDFDDMIPLYLQLTKIDDPYVKQFINTYKHVLVDECQDTNQIQYELIKSLIDNQSQLFMVGDDDQLIYSFRNSDINLFKEFKDKSDEVIILNQNYRCTTNILESANKLIQHNKNREHKKLFSNIQNNIPIKYKAFETYTEEAQTIVSLIEVLLEKKIEPYEIAILYRNNKQSFPIELELEKRKIKYNVYHSAELLKYEEVKSIISTFKLLINPEDILSLEKINYIPLMLTEAKDFLHFKTYHNKSNQKLYNSLRKYDNPKLNNLGAKLSKLQNLIHMYDKEQIFTEVLLLLKMEEYLKTSKNKKQIQEHIEALKNLIVNSKQSIEEFINELQLEPIEQKSSKEKIQLMTIHRAKGLEFKAVFIIGINEGILPPLKAEKDEERRLFYVAMTRAKEILYLSSAKKHIIFGKTKNLLPSTFITEADIYNENIKIINKYNYNE